MNSEARASPDVMITSAAPALDCWLYFCCWCHRINNLITSTVRSLRDFLKPRPIVLTSLSLGQYGKASVFVLGNGERFAVRPPEVVYDSRHPQSNKMQYCELRVLPDETPRDHGGVAFVIPLCYYRLFHLSTSFKRRALDRMPVLVAGSKAIATKEYRKPSVSAYNN